MPRASASPGSNGRRSSLQDFLDTDLDLLLERHHQGAADSAVLALARRMVAEVPAYRQFLARHGVADDITSLEDVRRLPPISKTDYHQAYPLEERCWPGGIADCDMIALSSGSTGEPGVWPRTVDHEAAVAARFEQVFRDAFQAERRTTLAVVCFALGSWVGGMYTASCCRHLASKGYRLTVATPGNQMAEIARVLERLGSSFEQIVLLGYPPFLKDVIEAMPGLGVVWPAGRVRLVTAGEVFSEAWRDLVCSPLGADPVHHTASLYGTADGGVLGCETPLSVTIRRFLAEHPRALRAICGGERLPTLCQYDPLTRWFERGSDGELWFSADGAVPLLRYRILDHGGIHTHAEMLAALADHGFDPRRQLPPDTRIRSLPFVWVYGRSHIAVSLDGANLYPEHIAPALERPPLSAHLSGKFVMRITCDAQQNPRLELILELRPGSEPGESRSSLAQAAAQAVRASLERLNSEFAHYVPDSRRTPLILLRAHRDTEWFPVGSKHRWVR